MRNCLSTKAESTERSRAGRVVGFISALGVLLAVLLGGAALPAVAVAGQPTTPSGSYRDDGVPGGTQRDAVDAGGSSDITRAVIVGGLAFVLMVGAAGGVLWYAAKSRGQEPN